MIDYTRLEGATKIAAAPDIINQNFELINASLNLLNTKLETVAGGSTGDNIGTGGAVLSVNGQTGNVVLVIPNVTDEFSATSNDAMSGVAVNQAISEAIGDIDTVLMRLGV